MHQASCRNCTPNFWGFGVSPPYSIIVKRSLERVGPFSNDGRASEGKILGKFGLFVLIVPRDIVEHLLRRKTDFLTLIKESKTTEKACKASLLLFIELQSKKGISF